MLTLDKKLMLAKIQMQVIYFCVSCFFLFISRSKHTTPEMNSLYSKQGLYSRSLQFGRQCQAFWWTEVPVVRGAILFGGVLGDEVTKLNKQF